MFDYNQLMALKQLVAQQEDQELVNNLYKGSALNPGTIGETGIKKQVAQPNAKVETRIGQKYIPKSKKQEEPQKKPSNISATTSKSINPKHQIWSQEEIKELPMHLDDPRDIPNFKTSYRQKVGTEDIYLGLSGVDPSSNHCNEILYEVDLPETILSQIQIDLNEQAMVIQTNKFYLSQYFQYPVDCKKAKAEFVSDKFVFRLILPVIKPELF